MGFLKNLLNPKSATRAAFDPAGGTIAGLRNNGDSSKGLLDPSGMLIKSGASGATPAGAADSSVASTFGDPNDPAYGSLTQPFDVEQFYKYEDPGYAFRLQQGSQAVQNSAAAGSGALSGAALKDLLGYNQDMGSTEYNNAFNRYQTQQGNIFQRLFSIAGLGESSAAQTGSIGATLAGNAGANTANAGTATGSGVVGGTNSINNGVTNAWLWNQFNNKQPAVMGTPNSVGFP